MRWLKNFLHAWRQGFVMTFTGIDIDEPDPDPSERKRERFKTCLFCGNPTFRDGPSGGVSQNIECDKCGARFNIMLVPGGPYLDMVIRKPTNTNFKPEIMG